VGKWMRTGFENNK